MAELFTSGRVAGLLRAALVDAAWPWMALPLLGALAAHVVDLTRRGQGA